MSISPRTHVAGRAHPTVAHSLRKKTGAAMALALLLLPAVSLAQQLSTEQLSQLRYRHIGPVGNRVSTVVGVRGDPMIYYAGAATGGVWKTEDGGLSWRPVFDDVSVHSIGSIAVALSDPNVVWVGTGESYIRSNVSIGNGVWRSTDAGETWEHMGLEGTGRIGRVVIHPTDPNVIYAAALGHGHAPQQERGIYRTTDGGASWEQVLLVDENTGASALVMDPNNPRILFAGMWQVSINTWNRESGGPGSGIYMTRNGGDSWKRLDKNGLPQLPAGKIDVCMTPKDSRRIYALIETGDGVPWHGEETESGELWRSDDGGTSWNIVNHDRDLAGRTAYYTRCVVSPGDADEAYFLAAAYSVTLDGGVTSQAANFFSSEGPSAPGWDHHDMWIDPTNSDRMIAGHDGGLSISTNHGQSWLRVQLPVAQMYHVTVDTEIPYNVLGNRQDGPSFRGPSNSRTGGLFGGSISRGMWHGVGGGESGFATPDPADPNIVWSSASGSGAVGGIVVRHDERTRQYRQVEVWPESTIGHPAENLRYRFQWTFPLLISPYDNETIYVTSQHVHRTTNRGQSWEVISPDLTTNDKSRQGISGGLTPDNLGVEYCCVIYAFDESPVEPGVFWAGSNDGLVHVSRNGGNTWTNVTDRFPDLPPDGVVRGIDASRWDVSKAYLVIEFHQVGNFEPYVFKTEDFGASWTKIVDGIADSPLSYTRWIHEDPVRPGLLYLGTENAIYFSLNDGGLWQSLMTNMPPAPIYGLVVQEQFNDLVVGSYGRGFWILDDITPLQQFTPQVAASSAYLFEPRPAYRFQPITAPMAMFDDPSAGDNPPYGASISYWLGEEVDGDVIIQIRNTAGETVRTLEGTSSAGLNRIWWDLRGEPTTAATMRTRPRYAAWFDLGPKRSFPLGGQLTILQSPGTYTVTLIVGDEEAGPSHLLEVRKDPNSEGNEGDIAAQIAMMEQIRADIETGTEMINTLEWLRRQLYDLQAALEDHDQDDVVAAAGELEGTLMELEERLIQSKQTGTGQDGVRWPAMLMSRFNYLGNSVSVGDFPPADEHGQVLALLEERLQRARGDLDALLGGDVATFNEMLRKRGLPTIINPSE